MSAPVPRHIEVLYCDDIRREMGNKISCMGIYSAHLVLPAFPAAIPRLCILVTAMSPFEEPFTSLRFRVEIDKQTIMESGDFMAQVPEEVLKQMTAETPELAGEYTRYQSVVTILEIGLVEVQREAVLRVVADTESGPLTSRILRIQSLAQSPAAANQSLAETG